jgi:hypothetical protein
MSGEFEPRCLVVACQQDWDLIKQALNARGLKTWRWPDAATGHGHVAGHGEMPTYGTAIA